jgi:hypothetical protein|tara:strand:- start:4654 stop:4776 length:123 start_codon:yes stop_codon:yes gene_type:complete
MTTKEIRDEIIRLKLVKPQTQALKMRIQKLQQIEIDGTKN